MLAENQRHLKNDCVDCKLQEFDNQKHCWTCLGIIIESNACISCHHYKIRETRKARLR